jgi:hypothetical protein
MAGELLKVGSSIASVLNGVNGLMTNVKKLGDVSLSTSEKILKVLPGIFSGVSSIGMGLSTLLPALKNIGTTFMASFGVWGIVIAAVVAALGILVGVLYTIAKNSTAEAKLAKAEESAKKFKQTLEDTKARADELNAAFDSYNSAIDKLEECREGTEEWKEALE